MPASFSKRLSTLMEFHNLMAQALAENRPGVPSPEVLGQLGIGRQALYDYRDLLQEMGAPVEFDTTLQLWRYLSVWNFPTPPLETLQGATGVRMALNFLLDPELERGLVGKLALDPDLRRGSTSLPRMTGRFSSDLLGRLARALKESRTVRFSYRKPGERTGRTRTAQPLSLFEWDGMPYLQARDPADPSTPFKRFALARMDRLEVLEERFRPPPRRQIPSCLGAFVKEVFTAVVEADAAHAPYVRERRWHPSQTIEDGTDGAVVFTLPFGDPGEAARWILGRGPGFRPLEPAPLVACWREMVDQLRRGR